jgi:hypothetical protein
MQANALCTQSTLIHSIILFAFYLFNIPDCCANYSHHMLHKFHKMKYEDELVSELDLFTVFHICIFSHPQILLFLLVL